MQFPQTFAKKWDYKLCPSCYTHKQSTARWVACVLFIGICIPSIFAQENTRKSLFLEELYEDNLLDEQQYENWEDSTYILPQHINLNTVDAQTLRTLPFLSERQINDIIMTRDFQGHFTSITDLRLIPCISPHTYTLLQQYCTIAQKSPHTIAWHDILHKSKHQIISQINIPLYKRQGYLYTSQKNKSPFYLGYPWSHYIRYNGHYHKQIYWGFTLAQGAGEPFFIANQNRYDYIGYYFLLQDKGRIRQLALGKYSVHFGLGLIINQNLLLGKGEGLEAKQTLKPLFSKHSSKSESKYLEGVATDLEVTPKIHVAAFASYRHLDASIKNNTIQSIQTTGYHRSIREINRRGQAQQYTIGARTYYRPKEQVQIALHALYTSYDKSYNPPIRYYNKYYFRGTHIAFVGTDYYLHKKNWYISGEIATSQNGGIALLQTAEIDVNKFLRLNIALRYYGVHYKPIFGHSLSAGSRVQNEAGLYIGVHYLPWEHGEISGYVDIYHSPEPTYGTATAATGSDCMLQLKQQHNIYTHIFRYRWQQKGKNIPLSQTPRETTQIISPYHKHQFKYQIIQALNSHWQNQAKIYATITGYQDTHFTQGLLGLVSSRYQNGHWILCGQLAIFNTDDYNSRCTIYEPSTQYDFYFPSCFGQGLRTALIAQYTMCHNHLRWSLKAGHFHYFDRLYISSAHDAIAAPYKTDLTIQCKWTW